MIIKCLHSAFYISIFCIFFSGNVIHAQNSTETDALLNSAGKLFDQSEEEKALQSYKKVLQHDSLHYNALWHTALLYARIGFRMDDQKQQENYYRQALKYAEKTIDTYPDSGYSHFVYAVANGRISDISATKERIRISHIVKEHTLKATELLPDYGPAWLLLGLWHSEVANISRAQELAASVVSKGIPEGASNQKAVEYIAKAIELNPDQFIRFKLDLGRHYKRSGENEKAIQALNEALSAEAQNHIDEWNQEQARIILEELK